MYRSSQLLIVIPVTQIGGAHVVVVVGVVIVGVPSFPRGCLLPVLLRKERQTDGVHDREDLKKGDCAYQYRWWRKELQ